MNKKIVVFGFKHVSPAAMNWAPVLDVRTLRNPWYPGITDDVGMAKVRTDPNFELAVECGLQLIAEHDVIYVGCYGGKHRSGAVAEEIAKRVGASIERV